MSEDKHNWTTIGIGIIIILSIISLIALILPLTNLAVETDEIAIIQIHGLITYNQNSTKLHTSVDDFKAALNEANLNPNVKAIVLDINSPGGSQVASEEICESIKKSDKVIIASIGDRCLDEAYLIASSANIIVANPPSTVGGIGLSFIDSKKYSDVKLKGTFDKKYLKKDYNETKNNLENSQKMINQDYTLFIKEIAENRNLTPKYISKLADGKKYNGNEAKRIGLIDKIGSIDKAIKIAASKSKISNYTIEDYPKKEKSLTDFLNQAIN